MAGQEEFDVTVREGNGIPDKAVLFLTKLKHDEINEYAVQLSFREYFN